MQREHLQAAGSSRAEGASKWSPASQRLLQSKENQKPWGGGPSHFVSKQTNFFSNAFDKNTAISISHLISSTGPGRYRNTDPSLISSSLHPENPKLSNHTAHYLETRAIFTYWYPAVAFPTSWIRCVLSPPLYPANKWQDTEHARQ